MQRCSFEQHFHTQLSQHLLTQELHCIVLNADTHGWHSSRQRSRELTTALEAEHELCDSD